MDCRGIIDHFKENRKKYRFPALVLLLGIILMTLPTKEKKEIDSIQTEVPNIIQTDLQEELEDPRRWKSASFVDGSGRGADALSDG